MADDEMHCSFCGKTRSQVRKLIQGPNHVYICDECVKTCEDIIKEVDRAEADFREAEEPQFAPAAPIKELPTPHEIYNELSQYVMGQEEAKRAMSVAVYNHYRRIMAGNEPSAEGNDVELAKSNILLLGPTGTGKTLLAQTLARFLDVPFSIADATVLTEAGYVGEDVENILVRLLQAADYDVPRAERGIIFVDEIDKIARKSANPSITRDVSGEGVQQGLLKILEGTVSSVPPKGGRKHPEQALVQINTRNILFICGGAFESLEKVVAHRVNKGGMGFGADVRSEDEFSKGELFKQLEPDDLIHFGLIPELVGRLPITVALDELDAPALLRILTEPKNALVKQYKKLFDMDGIKLEFTDDALSEIVAAAIARKTGARGLRSVIERALERPMFELPGSGTKKFTLTADMVRRGNVDPDAAQNKKKDV